MNAMPRNGSWVRARVLNWALCQANNQEAYPDPQLPTLEGIPEWVEGTFEASHAKAPWGEVDVFLVAWGGIAVEVDSDSVHAVESGPSEASREEQVKSDEAMREDALLRRIGTNERAEMDDVDPESVKLLDRILPPKAESGDRLGA